jgi:hypothetical protein
VITLPKCPLCSKEVFKCDKCGKLIFDDVDVRQFLDGEYHSCIKCDNEWNKFVDKIKTNIKLGSIGHYKLIRDWFNDSKSKRFMFR